MKIIKIIGIILAGLCSMVIVLAIIGSNTDIPNQGERVVVTFDYAEACPTEGEAAYADSLGNDAKAGGAFAFQAHCTFLRSKDQYVLQIKKPFASYWCLRREGDPNCFWVNKDYVSRPPKVEAPSPKVQSRLTAAETMPNGGNNKDILNTVLLQGGAIIGRAIACHVAEDRLRKVITAQTATVEVLSKNDPKIMKMRSQLIKFATDDQQVRGKKECPAVKRAFSMFEKTLKDKGLIH